MVRRCGLLLDVLSCLFVCLCVVVHCGNECFMLLFVVCCVLLLVDRVCCLLSVVRSLMTIVACSCLLFVVGIGNTFVGFGCWLSLVFVVVYVCCLLLL